ncbi:MAG: hypothetical protein LUQ35_03055 [Methanoregula sp.]|nr:hypothetical protein [Methanoregula sp.]
MPKITAGQSCRAKTSQPDRAEAWVIIAMPCRATIGSWHHMSIYRAGEGQT